MRKYFYIIFLAFSFISCETIVDPNPVNKIDTSLSIIRLFVDKEALINLTSNRFVDFSIPVRMTFNNKAFSGELEPAGAGSRFHPKYSFEIKLVEETLMGAEEIGLSSHVFDKTMMRTAVASYIYRQLGFPVFNSQPVFLMINNQNYGLYVMTERIEELFFTSRNIPVYELFQAQFDSKFSFNIKNNVRENFDKEIPDDNNFRSLEEMIHALDTIDPQNIFPELEKYLDVKNYLLYHAATTIRHDPDAFANNFFLYRTSADSGFKILPWDFDKTFFDFGQIGYAAKNDIINKLFQNDSCKTLYDSYMKFILENVFTESNLYPVIDSLAAQIRPLYEFDPYLNHLNFENEVADLKAKVTLRRNELLQLVN